MFRRYHWFPSNILDRIIFLTVQLKPFMMSHGYATSLSFQTNCELWQEHYLLIRAQLALVEKEILM